MTAALNPQTLSMGFRQAPGPAPLALDLDLPWSQDERVEKRFKRLLIGFIIAFLLLMLILSFAPLADRQSETEADIVATTQILLDPIEQEPPPPPPPEPKPQPKPEPAKPVEKTKALAKSPTPKPQAEPEPTSTGLNEVSQQLSALRESFDVNRLQKKNLSTSNAGRAEQSNRTHLGKDAVSKTSGGIEVDEAMMADERRALAAHNAAAVEGVTTAGVDGGSPVSRYASHISGERTMESIRYTLEKNKGGIFTLYYQALNKNPNIGGKYTFELRIEPSGEVSSLKLISSDLGDPQLDQAILDRIRKIKFREEDVIVARVTYTYNFIES